jgi:hypothetical protein
MKIMSEEAINKISETKLESGRQKIICGFVKNELPEQSDTKLAIPSHRTREFISFEDFKNFMSQGKSLKELCIKYSKHLMAFYSYLSQGKVTLTKEQFIEEYEKGIPLDEIGRSHGIPREHITYLREYYGIKRKGANYQKRLKNEVPLSQEAKDVIIGSLLGDGHITKWGYFSEKHSPAQLEYLRWKAGYLKDISTDKSWDYYEAIDKRSGTLIKSHCFRTTAHSFIYEMRNKFYKEVNGKWIKIIPNDIESMINEKVLVIWFMDDGTTDWKYRNEIKMTKGSLPSCKFCSESFSFEENQVLSLAILKVFNIKSEVKFKDGKVKPQIKFSTIDSVKFIQLIKNSILPELMYKVDEENYIKRFNI